MQSFLSTLHMIESQLWVSKWIHVKSVIGQREALIFQLTKVIDKYIVYHSA